MAYGCGAPIEREPGEEPEPGDAGASVAVTGRVTFDFVPLAGLGGTGLDYGATEARPARGVTVAMTASGRAVGTTVTDEDGRYRLDAPPESEVTLTVRAELGNTDSDSLARVLDNTRDNVLYTIAGTPFGTGDVDVVRDLHARSGWTGNGYGEARAAAPFAILDVLYDAVQWVRRVGPDVRFVPLDVFWSPGNLGMLGDDGEPDYAAGRIGATHYRRPGPGTDRAPAIYLLGAENEDTDEYDRSIVAHEWMHYFLDTLSRDDSVGGRHALGEQLDMRVAYSEGVATALAAAMAGESDVRYTLGPRQGYGGRFSVEGFKTPHPGWFSEISVMTLVYDLLDPVNDDELALGFEGIHEVLVNEMRETPALTTVFAFIDALKRRYPDRAAQVDALAKSRGIGPVADAFATGESNAGHPPSGDTLPVYSELTLNGEDVDVCSTAQFRGEEALGNALGVWRFLRFAATGGVDVTVSATPTSAPRGQLPVPRVSFYRKGHIGQDRGAPAAACTPDRLAGCARRVRLPQTRAGEYVVAVAEATNAGSDGGVRPIGRTCFNMRVTSP